MPRRSAAVVGLIVASYVLVALLQVWPLPLCLATHLTGDPSGDGGVYVWNTWVFRHELVDLHHSPFYTESMIALTGPADLSLHNYTVFANLVALPLQPFLGVVAAFNVTYLLNVPLIGLGMFLLARRIGRPHVGYGEAWLAGVFFAWAPFLTTRLGGHYSLALAAPLPFFAWFFDRAWERRSLIDALGAALSAAWAFYCDPYFAVYCALLAVAMTAGRLLVFRRGVPGPGAIRARRIIDAILIIVVALAFVIQMGGGQIRLIGAEISARSLYTPMLIAGVLLVVRTWLHLRPRVSWHPPEHAASLVRLAVALAIAGAVLIGPILYALVLRAVSDELVAVGVPWRSSAPGVDLLSFLLPNPNHPLAPNAVVTWLSRQPGGVVENVSSVSWVALATIAVASWKFGERLNRTWLAIALGAVSMAVGPFLRVGGLNTLLPTPWTFLRYVPIIGEARMPGRISIVVALAVGVMFASALAAWTRRVPASRRRILAMVAIALTIELWSMPRAVYSTEIPAVFRVIAADPKPVSVLELPLGLKDGLTTVGAINVASLYWQTLHGKPILGGYLSRISNATRARYEAMPIPAALLALSEGRAISEADRARARESAPAFLPASHIGYVVIEDRLVSADLRAFATDVLGLHETMRSEGFTLLEPRARP
ncbi:MAG: hypothetical protein ABI634_12710 [Acidobacteriota bacterium]